MKKPKKTERWRTRSTRSLGRGRCGGWRGWLRGENGKGHTALFRKSAFPASSIQCRGNFQRNRLSRFERAQSQWRCRRREGRRRRERSSKRVRAVLLADVEIIEDPVETSKRIPTVAASCFFFCGQIQRLFYFVAKYGESGIYL